MSTATQSASNAKDVIISGPGPTFLPRASDFDAHSYADRWYAHLKEMIATGFRLPSPQHRALMRIITASIEPASGMSAIPSTSLTPDNELVLSWKPISAVLTVEIFEDGSAEWFMMDLERDVASGSDEPFSLSTAEVPSELVSAMRRVAG